MTERPAHKYLRWVFTLLLTAAAVAAAVFLLPWLLKTLWPLVIAWCLAIITAPLVRFLQNKLHAKHRLSSTLVLILILAVVFGLLYGVVRLLISEAMTLIPNIPNYVTAASDVIDKVEEWLAGLAVNLPKGIFVFIDSIEAKAGEWFISISANFGIWLTNTLASTAVNLPNYLIYTILTVLMIFYIIDERDQLKAKVRKLLPVSLVSYWVQCTTSFKKAVGKYIVTQLKLCGIVGATMCVCFLLKGIKYTGLLTIAITILDFLPIVGAGTILNPWAVIELIQGDIWMALYCIVLYIITQVIRNSLSPKMMGDSLNIPPLTSILCMYLGFRFWGLGGMIISIPLWMVVLEIYKAGAFAPAFGVFREIWDEIDGILRKPGDRILQEEDEAILTDEPAKPEVKEDAGETAAGGPMPAAETDPPAADEKSSEAGTFQEDAMKQEAAFAEE